jgi:hypothetical protein
MRLKGAYVQREGTEDGKLLTGGLELLQLEATSGESELAFTLRAAAAAGPRVRVARIR